MPNPLSPLIFKLHGNEYNIIIILCQYDAKILMH